MKKIILASAVLVLALTGCQKHSHEFVETFSKASIILEVTNYDGTGGVNADFWNYISFNVYGQNFDGSNFSETLGPDKTGVEITCKTAPTNYQSYFANVAFVPVLKTLPADMNVNYCVRCRTVIYDGAGDILREDGIARVMANGPCKGSDFAKKFKDPIVTSTFELCYVKSIMDDWIYNFGITKWNVPM